MTLEEVIEATVRTIQPIAGAGIVDSRSGGASTWSLAPKRRQVYWIVGHESTKDVLFGVGGNTPGSDGVAQTLRRIKVDIWTPWNVDEQTGRFFRGVFEATINQLIENQQLGVFARMREAPILESNKIALYSSQHIGDTPVGCHHAVVAFSAETWTDVAETN